MDVAARLEAVEAENELLREKIVQLESMLGTTRKAPIELGLTGSEATVFGVLMGRDMVTKDALMAAVYRNNGKDEPELKIVDVFICKIRKKLKPFEIKIETVWGQGYRLSPAAKARVNEMFKLEVEPA